ncbi:hypothetical protein [Pseudomonas fragariae (ex Marin et al. 2024)]|uniref:hypothetical protein n=1 Tax=Pseudomonas fragariae (ex Marin et al. 2024) TaxID=3080056 RepID=UPI003F79CE1E
MTAYTLTGSVVDDEGVSTIIDEFTTSAARVDQWINFYTSNDFTGALILTVKGLDGIRSKQRIVLDRCKRSGPGLTKFRQGWIIN